MWEVCKSYTRMFVLHGTVKNSSSSFCIISCFLSSSSVVFSSFFFSAMMLACILWLSVSGRLSLLNTPQHHPVRTFYGELSKNFDKAPWQTIVNQHLHYDVRESSMRITISNWQSKLCMTLLSHAGTRLGLPPTKKSWNSS